MNYYEHYLGDYLRDTMHLSMLEDGAYRRLLDVYYSRKGPLHKDSVYRLARAESKLERKAVDKVLEQFFNKTGPLWVNYRCEQEITRYHDRRRKAQLAGIASGNARRTNVATDVERTLNGSTNPPAPAPSPTKEKESEGKNALSRKEELGKAVTSFASNHRIPDA